MKSIEKSSNVASQVLKENLVLWNTMTRGLQPFVPLSPNEVSMYTCGPTVYKRAHIGNFRANIFADTLKRTLERCGYHVKHVINITDVGHLVSDADDGEDKMEKEAKVEKMSAWQIAEKYTDLWLQDRQRLHLLDPAVLCKATDYISQQIELVRRLETNGFTYLTRDGVYFDTSLLADYGRLARLDVSGLSAGIRVEMGEKRNPTDFALWKFAAAGVRREMEWDSPWGAGFPGWHIECSAMIMEHLGPQIDVHTGGVDLIPVHHVNEIAQSEAATGLSPFVQYWLHSEFLTLLKKSDTGEDEEVKMSKSLGNTWDLDTLAQMGISPLGYKYMCLTAKYGQKLRVSESSLVSGETSFKKLHQSVGRVVERSGSQQSTNLGPNAQEYARNFDLALANDINTPVALAVLWEMLKDTDITAAEQFQLAMSFDQALGLDLDKQTVDAQEVSLPIQVQALIEQRAQLKREKNWEGADALRDQIAALGFQVTDTKEGPKVTRK